jgi:hypothetical protein
MIDKYSSANLIKYYTKESNLTLWYYWYNKMYRFLGNHNITLIGFISLK